MLEKLISSGESEPGINVLQFLMSPTHLAMEQLKNYEDSDFESVDAKLKLRSKVDEWALKTNCNTADTGHLLLALRSLSCTAQRILETWELHVGDLLEELKPHWAEDPVDKIISEGGGVDRRAWTDFGRDLTELAKSNPKTFIGREKEIQRVIQILSLSEANHPILVGEPGSGKTAIIEGIAQAIANDSDLIPESLKGVRIFELNITAMVAGTTLRGELEERALKITEGIKSAEVKTILLLDDIHHLTRSGSRNSSSDASIMLGPAIANGEIQSIGTTNSSDIIRMERQGGFIQNYQKIAINPPSNEETLEILRGKKSFLESHHNVEIPDDVLKEVVKAADQEIPNRFFPKKGVHLLDQTCASAKEKRLARLNIECIYDALHKMTGIPNYRFNETAAQNIDRIQKVLDEAVIGQAEAKKCIMTCLTRAHTCMKDSSRPIANILLLGEAGTGKTLTCKTLAKALFGKEESMIRFDMGEFQSQADVPQIIGFMDHPGKLAMAITQNPYQIVLFDEIEKAHPDIFDCLLQIMEEGKLTDGTGIIVDMRHCMIMMTSNVGSHQYGKGVSGFGDSSPLEDRIHLELKKTFRPEFIDRFDEITIFEKPSDEDILEMCRIEVRKMLDRALQKEITLYPDEEFLRSVMRYDSQEELRGRKLRRIIERTLGNEISEKILREKIRSGETYKISGDLENIQFIKEA